MHELFDVYHEMDISQFFKYFESLRTCTAFQLLLERNNITLQSLSMKTGISVSTLKSLKNGSRDFKNLNGYYLEIIAHYLNVEMQTLLGNITLDIL